MLHGVTCDDTTATDSEIAIFVGNDGREIRGSDVKMSATPTATTVVVSDASGKLAAGWGGAASSLATLNASAKVVELPADATATPSANSIPISTAQSKLDGWVSEATATTAGRSKILVATAIKTGNYTCTSSYSKVRVNPTGGAFWVKPIAEPADGDLWAIVNEYSSANTITATANTATVAQTIEGGASLALASPFFSVVFQYNLALLNWTIYAMS
jgi:hypothetical protein